VSSDDFRAFLASAETQRWIRAIVRERAPADATDDLVQDAIKEALTAFVRAPPSKDAVLIVWIATIARRVVADYLTKRGRRRKYEGPMPHGPLHESESSSGDDESDGATEPSYDPREDSLEGDDLRGRSLFRWLERRVARSPIDRETLAILLEHGLGDKTYRMIADERGIPLTVLSSRIFEFRKKYIARYKRERDRTVLLLLFFLGAAVVAVLVWLFSRHDEPPHGTVRPSTPSILERTLGNPLPVSRPRPDDALELDAGAGAPPR
jgi:DNA-directed RNA polymerase specialized sigma24 family protein